MLTVIPDLPPYVLGVRASGEVDKNDLEQVLLPGLQHLTEQYDAIHYLLVLETEVGNFTAGAWLQDLKAGLLHFSKWKKIAVVSSQKGVQTFTDLFSFVTPGVAKGFEPGELQEAINWVSVQED
jgi:hypothetical protein